MDLLETNWFDANDNIHGWAQRLFRGLPLNVWATPARGAGATSVIPRGASRLLVHH
jgi:hypothetical protein